MSWLACYIRLERQDDGYYGLHNDAVYFAGISDDKAEAEEAARESVRSTWEKYRSFILPRVFEREEGASVIDGLYAAAEWFEKKLRDINESVEITDSQITRLSDEQVRALRACQGVIGSRETANRFGVSRTTVKDIWSGKARSSVI